MPLRIFPRLLVAIVLALSSFSARAQAPLDDLKALVGRIQAKISSDKHSAADFAPEIADFDALVAKYKDQKNDEIARIAYVRATFYLQVLNDETKARELLKNLVTDYPGTEVAKVIEAALAGPVAQSAIVGKPAPELHFNWASAGNLKSLSELKGKVVVLDFWATWCGPCIASFPQMRELVDYYKGSDVVVVGVTSIQGRVANLTPTQIDTQGDPKKEVGLMPAFIKAKNMTWTVAFSDEEVFNPAYGIDGIPHMTIIAPDGTVRHNDLHPAMPHAEKVEKIDAILKEFGRKIPSPSKA